MGNTTIRIRTDSAGNAVGNLSKKISEGRNAKDKVSSAIFKIKWDDIFSIGHYSKSLYNNLDASKDKLNKLNNKLEALTSSAKDAVNAFADADMGAKTKGKKKKRDWEKIFKELTRYSVKTTIGALLGGVGGYIIANGINDGISSKNNAASSGNSITVIKKEKDKKINSKEIENKGKKVDDYYEKIKEETFGKRRLDSFSINGEDGYLVKNGANYEGPAWNQLVPKGNNDIIACPGYSEAAYQNMVSGQDNYNYMDYWSGSSWKRNPNGPNVSKIVSKEAGHDAVMNMAFERLNDGVPSIVSVNSPIRGDEWHYVVITGIKKSAVAKKMRGGNLEMSDFIIYDPAGGTTCPLTDAGGHPEVGYNTSCSQLWG